MSHICSHGHTLTQPRVNLFYYPSEWHSALKDLERNCVKFECRVLYCVYISDVAIPGLESVAVPNFEVFSDNCDSNSNSGSNRCWN